MHVNSIGPLAPLSGCIHVAGLGALFPGVTGVSRGRPGSGLTFGKPLPAGAVTPGGFLGDLQESPTASAESGTEGSSNNVSGGGGTTGGRLFSESARARSPIAEGRD